MLILSLWWEIFSKVPSLGLNYSVYAFPIVQAHVKFKHFYHAFFLGWNKCWKEFPRKAFGDKSDYSGFDCNKYTRRYGKSHKLSASWIICKDPYRTKMDGKVWSPLFRTIQSYFEPIKMHVVDPMHNLLLGTAKRIFKI